MSKQSGWMQVGPFLVMEVLGLMMVAGLPALGIGVVSYLVGFGFWLNALIAWGVVSVGLIAFYLGRT